MQKTNKQDLQSSFNILTDVYAYTFLLKGVLEKIFKSVTWQKAYSSLFYKDPSVYGNNLKQISDKIKYY